MVLSVRQSMFWRVRLRPSSPMLLGMLAVSWLARLGLGAGGGHLPGGAAVARRLHLDSVQLEGQGTG